MDDADTSLSPFQSWSHHRKTPSRCGAVKTAEGEAENQDPKQSQRQGGVVVVLSSDDEEDEDSDEEEVIITKVSPSNIQQQQDVLFASPPTTKKGPPVPYSSKRGRPSTRIVEMLRSKLRELAAKPELEDKDGFYSLTWQYDDSLLQSKAVNPAYNVSIICTRIRTLYADLAGVFTLSGVYIGKSSKLRMGERFGLHRNKTKDKTNACVAMIVVATFAYSDVPDAFLLFEENGEDLALKYEKLVLKNISGGGGDDDTIPLYSDTMDAGGGGKVGLGISDGVVYALVVLGSK